MIWRRLLLAFLLVVNVVLAYRLIWSDTQGILAYKALKEHLAVQEGRIKDLDEKNVALSREIRLLQSDEKYLEKIIRKRLNFVKDNEILYIFPDVKDTARTGARADETKN